MKNRVSALGSWLGQNIITVVFLGSVTLMGLWQLFLPDRTYSASERRLLAAKPELSAENVLDASYMESYEMYLTDQFPMRDAWITLKTYSGLLLGQRESGGVYIAQDNSLIELHTAESIDAERAENNTEQLLSFLTRMAEQYGAEHVRAMLVPTADNIWAEKLSRYAEVYDQSGYLQEVQERLAQAGIAECYVDVQAALQEQAGEAIYYKTDHHWTLQGAYYGYLALRGGASSFALTQEMPECVQDSFHGTTAAKCGMYQVSDEIFILPEKWVLGENEALQVDHNLGMTYTDSIYDMEKAATDDPYEVYLGGNDAIVTIAKDAGAAERSLLIVKDSYANCIVPYLLHDYDTITLIDLRFYNGSVSQLMEEGGYTDLCVLYNIPNFLTERTISGLGR